MAAKKSKKKKDGDVKKGFIISAGIAAAATAGYLLFGPNGKQNRKKIKAWTVKAKGEILEKMEKMEHIAEDNYLQIVDQVSAKYAKLKDIDKADIEKFVKEAKKHWKKVEKDVKPKAKPKPKTSTKKKTTAAKKKPSTTKKSTTKKK